MAQTYGVHQGARVTSAGFEVSGGLQMAGEERDEDEDEGEASTSWWRWHDYHMCRTRSTRGLVCAALEDSRCGSPVQIPSSALAPPLHLLGGLKFDPPGSIRCW